MESLESCSSISFSSGMLITPRMNTKLSGTYEPCNTILNWWRLITDPNVNVGPPTTDGPACSPLMIDHPNFTVLANDTRARLRRRY